MSRIYRDGNEFENPLARFKSYSYYHILVMCDSTETAQELATTAGNDPDVWKHPDMLTIASGGLEHASDLGMYAPKTSPSGRGQYCVLINGATDARVVITKTEFSTLAAAGAVNNDGFTSLAVEGTMDISEPRGVTFLDVMTRCCAALGKDAAHVVYSLKTIFVGHADGDTTDIISNVAPLSFILTDASGKFSELGANYNFEFVCVTNGITRMPQYDKMVRTNNIMGVDLTDACQRLQTEVNAAYARMYGCVFGQVALSEEDLGYSGGELTDHLRPVEYVIELHELYQKPDYKLTPNSQQEGETGQCGEPGRISMGRDTSLESALHVLMQNCTRVEQDSVEGVAYPVTINGRTIPPGTRMQYKIRTELITTSSADGNPSSYTVKYIINPFPMPRTFLGMDQDTVENFIKPNTIEFDYIYTGKNIDILDFEMNVNMGLAYLQIATLTNTFKNQGEDLAASVTLAEAEQVAQTKERMNAERNKSAQVDIPVFFSTNINLPYKRTTTTAGLTASTLYDMKKHSSVEVQDVAMTITGNLTLLDSAVGSTHNSPDVKPDTTDWGAIPGFAKVNIRMPANSDDVGLFEGRYGESFTKDFWFQGYYYILGIDHVFQDGDFYQKLEMIGLPDPDIMKSLGANHKSNDKSMSARIEECYDNKSACDGEQQAGNSRSNYDVTTINRAPAFGQGKLPANDIDKAVHNADVENISGWHNMDPKNQSMIKRVTAGDKIPLSTYVGIMTIESNGRPLATSQTGAKGLFQFTQGTWNETMPNHRVPANPDPRNDPELNTIAAKKYLNRVSNTVGSVEPTWLYMGHNLGPGAARAVKQDVEAGRCTPMKELYMKNGFKPFKGVSADKQWETFAKGNGYAVNSSSCDVRDQVAGKYGRYLKEVPKPAKPTEPQPPPPVTTQAVEPESPPPVEKDDILSGSTPNRNVGNVGPGCATGESGLDEDHKEVDHCNVDAEPNDEEDEK